MACLTELELRYLYQLHLPHQQRDPKKLNQLLYYNINEVLIPFMHRSNMMTYGLNRFHQFRKMYLPLPIRFICEERVLGSPQYRYVFWVDGSKRLRVNWYSDCGELYTDQNECLQNCHKLNESIYEIYEDTQKIFDRWIYSLHKYQQVYFP